MLTTANTDRMFPNNSWAPLLIVIIAMMLYSSLASAAIYQCRNSSGKIAFQDHPCNDTGINDNRYHDKTGTIAKDDKKHFLWKATRNGETVYLLGSIHVGRPDMYPLSVSVMDAFNKSDVLMVEVNAEDVDQLELAQHVNLIGMYPQGTTLESKIPPEVWESLVATAKALNVPEVMFQQQKPWLANITLASAMMNKSGYQAEYGIDKHFLKQAKASNKEILELESVTSQMQLFSSLSEEEQLSLLKNGLKEMQQGSVLLDKLVNAWVTGDHQAIDKISRENMGIDTKNSSLYKVMILDRNHSMAEKIINLIKDHRKYYVVVGAAHLVGAQGIPELLKAQGFLIEEL
ncbi:MAG TPA: hypothetical protein ENJ32_10045 [Crenotrichaceae bacterium]|nr:hypothetical protein [Crenotrichaceae bacterium]